jgi:hypothetical protein
LSTAESEERWLRWARSLQTENEWRSCEFPHQIIRLLPRWRVSDRKALLFTAACLRRLWHYPAVELCHQAVEILERQAEGRASAAKVRAAAVAVRDARLHVTDVMGRLWWQVSSDYTDEYLGDAYETAWSTAEAMTIAAGRLARVATGLPDERPEDEHRAAEERAQCELLRCVFGSPFRYVRFDPAWRSAAAVGVAAAAYQERNLPSGTLDSARLAVLADALEEAGCAETAILEHCRQPGEHVTGCWVVELVLGKDESGAQGRK